MSTSFSSFLKKRKLSSKDLLNDQKSSGKSHIKSLEEDKLLQENISPFNTALDLPRLLFKELLQTYQKEFIVVFEQVFGVEQFDTVAQSLLCIFQEDPKRVETLFRHVFEAEISNTSDENTLFRGSSMAIKLFGHYMGAHGKDYLGKAILPFATKVVEDNRSFEIDQTRSGFEQDNIPQLLGAVDHLVDEIEASLGTPSLCKLVMPFPILAEAVAARFPELSMQIVGGFFFLRYICPYLVNPPMPKISSLGRRNLILVSKIIQNLSNGLYFGEKEEYLQCANGTIEKNLLRVNTVLQYISSEQSIPKLVLLRQAMQQPQSSAEQLMQPEKSRPQALLDNHQASPRGSPCRGGRSKPVSSRECVALDDLQALCSPKEYIIKQALMELSGVEASEQFEFIMAKYRAPVEGASAGLSESSLSGERPSSPAAKLAENHRYRRGSPVPTLRMAPNPKKREVKSANGRIEGTSQVPLLSFLPSSPRSLLPSSPRGFAAAAKVKFANIAGSFQSSFDENGEATSKPPSNRKRESPESESKYRVTPKKQRDAKSNLNRDCIQQSDLYGDLLECDTWEF